MGVDVQYLVRQRWIQDFYGFYFEILPQLPFDLLGLNQLFVLILWIFNTYIGSYPKLLDSDELITYLYTPPVVGLF